LELACHGWNHENFVGRSIADQASLLKKSRDKIKSLVFPLNAQVKVFIPPFSEYDFNTLMAMKSVGNKNWL
jgi:peptidoglycan/xylan/chitin deacetylase (PgdA/CDA1 family)